MVGGTMDAVRKQSAAPAVQSERRTFELPKVGDRVGRACGMVRWYDPRQLFRTGPEVGLSLALGARTDQRVLDSIAAARGTVSPSPSSKVRIVRAMPSKSRIKSLNSGFCADSRKLSLY